MGRAEQRAAVRAVVDGVRHGYPMLVWVEGEAGSGKSALVDALVGELPSEFGVLRAETDELDADEPLALAIQLGASYTDAPGPAAIALLRCWAALQDDGPLAVIVEDLHWADPDSRAALLTAIHRLAGDRVLMVVTSRPGVTDGWSRMNLDTRRCLRIDVGPLSVSEVAELAALYRVRLGERAAARLHAHTLGHALYVRTLLSELTLQELTRSEGALPAPLSLASTTLAAVSVLPDAARQLALALAVVARPVPLLTASRIAGVCPTAAIHLARAVPSLAGDRLPRAHLQLANALVLTGDWISAAVHARLASGLVDEENLLWVRAQAEGIHARLAGCVRGDWLSAEAHLQVAGEAAEQLGSLEATFTTLFARAVVAESRGDMGSGRGRARRRGNDGPGRQHSAA